LFKAANYSLSSRVFAEYFCSDMSHRPSKVNKAQMHCHGLLKIPRETKAIKHISIAACCLNRSTPTNYTTT
jgi:hypothetical protein